MALFLMPAVALADEAPVDIGEVRVQATAEYESLESVGAFTTVIKPKNISRTKTTPEVLSETAGVDVTSLGGEGQLSTVSIRGSSAEQVAVFVDGVRLNSPIFGSVDFATVPIGSIERIEVIRGAASARFGTDAIGGVINIVTKQSQKKRAMDFSLTGGSFQTLRTSESWAEPMKDVNLVLSHNHRSTGGDYTFRGAVVSFAGRTIGPTKTYTRVHNASISEDVLAKVEVKLSDKSRLNLSNDFFWTWRQVPGSEERTTLLYPAIPLEATEEIFRNLPNVNFFLDEFFAEQLSFTTGASVNIMNDHFVDPYPVVTSAIDTTYKTYSPKFYAAWMYSQTLSPVQIAATLRYDFSFDYSDDSSAYPNAVLMGEHTRQTNSVFLEPVVSFLDERFVIVPQLRLEKATKRKFYPTWKMGVVGRPLKWIELRANAFTSFRYPNFSELYWPDQGYLRGNPALSDEQALGFDAGFVLKSKFASLEFAYFQNRIDNQILFVPISALTIQPVNTSRVFTQGVELSGSFDPVKYFHLTANYSWLDATFKSTGLRLPGRPENKANAYAEVRVDPVTIFGRVQYVGRFPANVANTVIIAAHTAVDAGMTCKISKYFYATFEAKDINDVQIYDARAFPLPRRSYWATLGAKVGG